MPQKPVFSRPPILTVPHCFPAAGTVRAADERIARLYQKADQYNDNPCLWEGLFRLACLIRNKPAEETVAERIRNAIRDSETGAFNGSFHDQICTARAALALFEYNTDRTILKRIAAWLRYIEIESDQLMLQDGILYRPADLMELLIRYYQVSGVKSALRLCARLRAEAFDWVTALHTFQQTIPIRPEANNDSYSFPAGRPGEIGYDEKEKLINHAEMLADGVRYTLYAGIFSGHRQDLSAGKAVWSHLLRHHRALCGGTTGAPFLCGNAADQPVSNRALAAWAEAFGAQMNLSDFSWAADELLRIIRNGLEDCLNREEIYRTQLINTIRKNGDPESDPAALYARLCRAVVSAYRHAVTLTEAGFRINYRVPGKFLLMARKQPVILLTGERNILFQCRKPVSAQIEIYLSPLCAGSVRTIRNGHPDSIFRMEDAGCCIRTDTEWTDQDRILFEPDGRIVREDTHHKGIAFLDSGRLLCMPADKESFAMAVCGDPFRKDDTVAVRTVYTEKWKIRAGQPSDIPVLPEEKGELLQTQLMHYSECPCRITMFPRTR